MASKKAEEPKRPRGRPTVYSHAVAERICARIAAGESLRAICKDDDMPPEASVRNWVVDDREGFAARYTRAREIGLDAMADELMEIADDGTNDFVNGKDGPQLDGEHVQRSRLRVDARKWYLSKIAPKKYGDRQELHHTADVSMADAILAARQRSRG